MLAFAKSTLAGPPDDSVLDTRWGLLGSGKTFVQFDLGGVDSDVASDVLPANDGSSYLIGTVQTANGTRMGVVKLDERGMVVWQSVSDASDGSLQATTATFDSQGQILVGGSRLVSGDDTDFAVCRFNPATGDPALFPNTFNKRCIFLDFNLGGNNADVVESVLVQDDGKIILAGNAAIAVNNQFAAFARINPVGAVVEEEFGNGESGGRYIRQAGYQLHDISEAKLASNGKIVAVGTTLRVGEANTRALVMRVNSDGTVDCIDALCEYSFFAAFEGIVNTGLSGLVLKDNPNSAEDDIVAVGRYGASTENGGLIAKIIPNGADDVDLDVNFGSHRGSATATGGAGIEFKAIAAEPATDRFIILASYEPTAFSTRFLLGGYDHDGNTDPLLHELDFFSPDPHQRPQAMKISNRGIYLAGYGGFSSAAFLGAKVGDRIFYSGIERLP